MCSTAAATSWLAVAIHRFFTLSGVVYVLCAYLHTTLYVPCHSGCFIAQTPINLLRLLFVPTMNVTTFFFSFHFFSPSVCLTSLCKRFVSETRSLHPLPPPPPPPPPPALPLSTRMYLYSFSHVFHLLQLCRNEQKKKKIPRTPLSRPSLIASWHGAVVASFFVIALHNIY